MKKFFLTAPHWKIFLLVFLIPGSSFLFSYEINFSGFFLKFQFVFILLFVYTFSSWMWHIATTLSLKTPREQPFKLKRFKVFLILPVFHFFVLSPFLLFISPYLFSFYRTNLRYAFLALIVLFNLFSVFCIFYTIYQNAKILKSIELNRRVFFSDIISDFIALIFFPLGIWLLQPRINEYYLLSDTTVDLADHLIEK